MSSSETYAQDPPQSKVYNDYILPSLGWEFGQAKRLGLPENRLNLLLDSPTLLERCDEGHRISHWNQHYVREFALIWILRYALEKISNPGYYATQTEVNPAQHEFPSTGPTFSPTSSPGALSLSFSTPSECLQMTTWNANITGPFRVSQPDPVVPRPEARQYPKPIQRPTKIVDAVGAEAQSSKWRRRGRYYGEDR
ncbi:hypothetical protein BT96DRAFT_996875 [Gymnopus androsaceus JB14]|uniref:Uncharacterized protein n=1 Tax=Gymnopus androsaceus JB14 TaxID=1447944 RepID=A0A6A4HD46_9AGAR|nr:hypothetical protein BT96DRAFT_996875 [Gymnopus androsaceus JB14]